MEKLIIVTDPKFEEKIENYPDTVKQKMENLRKLVRIVAQECENIDKLVETLKWNEPSFITKHGSTLRMDWKEKTPNQYAMYFQCSSRLVDTFKMIFENKFQYEGNRAIIFQLDQDIPIAELNECIKATLNYHNVKDHLTLGI